jgi:hypothetical protein
MLLKLRAPAGPARTEVLQLAEIFRARVVDVSERCLTLCVSGDPGKVSDRPFPLPVAAGYVDILLARHGSDDACSLHACMLA